MITLNDYLYSGDTVLKILHKYSADLREDLDRELKRKGERRLPPARVCSGSRGSWKRMKDSKNER